MKTISSRKKDGFIMLVVVIIFLLITLGAAFSLSSVVYRQSAMVRNSERSMQSFLASESLQEDILYRLIEDKNVSSVERLVVGGAEAEAIVEETSNGRRVISQGNADNRIRKSEMVVTRGGSGVVFFYGVQSGQGGITLTGSASVQGDLYANGPVQGGWRMNVSGDVVSAGPNGLINNIAVGGSAYANRIERSWVTGDAYYKSIFDTTVGGNNYPGSEDMPMRDLPISDEEIEGWKADAEAGGVHTAPCHYYIGGVTQTSIGNVRIDCNLTIGGSSRVEITGPIWVRGNISFEGASRTFISPELEGKTITIVADDPSNRMNGSTINVGGSAEIRGAGEGSYILLVSQNESAENGGNTTAINVGGGGPHNDILIYAGHGRIRHGGSASVPVGVTGYQVEISGAARVQYQDGAANLDISDTPTGGYSLDTLREIQ